VATIAQISDTHIDARASGARARLDDLARTIVAINALRPRPLATIHTGDVAHNGDARDYAAARAALSRLETPLFAIPGNRDRREEFSSAFPMSGEIPSDRRFIQFAAEVGPLWLLGIDTLDGESGLGAYCDERAAGLKSLLATTASRPLLVMLHHPPLVIPSLPSKRLQFRDAGQADALRQTLESIPHLIGAVAGHVHRSDSVTLGRVQLTTMPSIAVDLRWERTPYGYTTRSIFHLHRFDGRDLTTACIVAG